MVPVTGAMLGMTAWMGRTPAGYTTFTRALRNIGIQKEVPDGITPYISIGRERHAGGLARFREPAPLAEGATARERLRHRLRTTAGRAIYGQRKWTIEPRFGNIKSVLGFRQFLLRGLEKVRSEWKLVATAYNLKRMHALARKAVTAA